MPLADFAPASTRSSTRPRRVLRPSLARSTGPPFALALAFLLAMQLARAWAWRNVLRAAYPGGADLLPAAQRRLPGWRRDQRDRAGAGGRRHQSLPRQAPDPRLLLPGGHLLVPRADGLRHDRRAAGLAYAITQGLLPEPPQLPNLPAFEISFWAEHPRIFLIVTGALLLAARDRRLPAGPPGAPLLGPGQTGRGHPQRRRAATCARSPPGRASAGFAASPPSGSSSRPSASAARSAT